MIAREWHCDGPECDHHTHAIPQPNPPHGWYILDAGTGSQNAPARVGEFCSLDCVMKYAAQFDPPTVIYMDDRDADGDAA